MKNSILRNGGYKVVPLEFQEILMVTMKDILNYMGYGGVRADYLKKVNGWNCNDFHNED